MTPTERFRSKVDASGSCWLWTAKINNRGYGLFYLNGKMRAAHRVAYELSVGPVPDGLELDHLCRNRLCVNPAHLEPVTHHENLLRGSGFAALNAAKTHCANGHEYTPENTYKYQGAEPARSCRSCKRQADARYRTRRKAVL